MRQSGQWKPKQGNLFEQDGHLLPTTAREALLPLLAALIAAVVASPPVVKNRTGGSDDD
jgi:hypothetical protein